jgi:hypothetical protein
MIREISDGDPAPLLWQVPKYVKLAMYEGKYDFHKSLTVRWACKREWADVSNSL